MISDFCLVKGNRVSAAKTCHDGFTSVDDNVEPDLADNDSYSVADPHRLRQGRPSAAQAQFISLLTMKILDRLSANIYQPSELLTQMAASYSGDPARRLDEIETSSRAVDTPLQPSRFDGELLTPVSTEEDK